jgi:hypothetical protein
LHLRSGILNILLSCHPGQALTDLLFDDALDILSRQLVRLSLADDFL